jgi:hypothetical protein
MCLLSQFIFRVAICVNRAIQLFKCHQSHDEFIVSMQETTEPLLVFDIVNLY